MNCGKVSDDILVASVSSRSFIVFIFISSFDVAIVFGECADLVKHSIRLDHFELINCVSTDLNETN